MAQFFEIAQSKTPSEEADRLFMEIEDIKKDILTHDKFTDALIVKAKSTKTPRFIVGNRGTRSEPREESCNQGKRAKRQRTVLRRQQILRPLESGGVEGENPPSDCGQDGAIQHQGSMFQQIKARESKIAELSSGGTDTSAVFKEVDPLTGEESYFMTQIGTSNMPEDDGDSLREMGKEFRAFVSDAKNQRMFKKDKLVRLLGNYKRAIFPEYPERAIIESILDELIRMPDMTRKDALLSLTPLMRPNVRQSFDRVLTMNSNHHVFKKMIGNPCDGSEDWRSEKDSKTGRGRRGGHNNGGQPKKQKTDHQGDGKNPETETATREAAEEAENHDLALRRARGSPTLGELLKTNKPKPREAAIAFFICFTTGARMKETLNLRVEVREVVTKDGNEFWRFHIRSSKTDPFCKRMETLTIPMDMRHGVPLALELRAQLKYRDSGLVLKILEGHTRIASDY
ncbi:Oidioi.mRNA.OKI2018_I69.YSR.g17149.t1.cds [Oikopleura dioica]|uniref:Oidioi.mRNA.OKI2018_I69.YSR.g17149.t1.cds n=1 Tax=Oikopleura dioica TaxID=34765 RepID=A0ABN7SM48_OIKDI|nr:Oidioi.mRNA.OKI2018_I69.YSR.g17149.t1.cds [Oikopleura dioica]